jgi:hypothetical protein
MLLMVTMMKRGFHDFEAVQTVPLVVLRRVDHPASEIQVEVYPVLSDMGGDGSRLMWMCVLVHDARSYKQR